jgi:3-oxoacyl-[acyl-carrier protein] reductase
MSERSVAFDDLPGRVAIVTGASMGLGAVMARALAEQGVHVIGVARNRKNLDDFASSVNDSLGRVAVHALAGDVSSHEVCKSAVSCALEKFRRIDIIINNAGVGSNYARPEGFKGVLKFWDCDPQLWLESLRINAAGPFFLAHCAVPHMLERGWGRIINNTTNFHTMLGPGRSSYGPGKAALEASTLIWSKELAGTGVTSNILIPGGPTATPIHEKSRGAPLDQMLRPDIMAAPVLWLASRASDGVTGMRFSAKSWDVDSPPEQAAARAGQPAAWDQLSTRVAEAPRYFD